MGSPTGHPSQVVALLPSWATVLLAWPASGSHELMEALLSWGREGVGRCRGPAPGQAAGLKQGPIRSSMAWGPPPRSSQGQPDGHESAQGASGSPDLTTGWWQGRPGGGLSSLGRAGTGQEESPAGVGQALTSFSILRNTASTCTQKAPLGGPPWASCPGLVIPLSIHRPDTHPAQGCFLA